VVFLPAGCIQSVHRERSAYALTITSSNVVLRGAGIGTTFLLNTSTNMRSKSIILLSGSSSAGFYSSGAASTTISQDLLGPTMEIPVASTMVCHGAMGRRARGLHRCVDHGAQ